MEFIIFLKLNLTYFIFLRFLLNLFIYSTSTADISDQIANQASEDDVISEASATATADDHMQKMTRVCISNPINSFSVKSEAFLGVFPFPST